MGAANLHLSPEERKLVTDAAVILTKNSVMAKVVGVMAELSEAYRSVWEAAAPRQWEPASPKISRGENYQGLPWVMLDYPRSFGREDVLAIRTFFWWGNTFSVTLHLKGCYKAMFLPVIETNWAELAAVGFHVGVSADEWRHEHVPENYGAVREAADLRTAGDFLKLSAAIGLDRWEAAPGVLLGLFKTLISVLFSAKTALDR